ncbi:DNA gyrase subunit B [Kitasatospora sp. Root107]|uniref:DNA gyrase subunit B n=1 Tax=Kitasatospora sp. Root107 TaxID=1736424 RepID=UPI00070B9121|nr:DNA gyrase subunit B [Kitasatospora sp. Root107]KQV12647.1 DNA gyrase subunit B [Kitasatospora sp. Root107]
MSEGSNAYDASRIQVLEGWDAVRARPGMYIGSTDERGLHRMVFEVAGRAVNEVLAGRAGCVDITLTADAGVRVADDGPGVRIDGPAEAGGSSLEALLTRMEARASYRSRHDVTPGHFWMGPGTVSALSSRMTAEVQCDGVRWVQEYARGVAVAPPADAGPAVGRGTALAFWPDGDIFGSAECSFGALADRFRELAFLNRDLDISLTDCRGPAEPRSVRFRFPGGVRDFVGFLEEGAGAPVHPDVIGFEQEHPTIAGAVEVALRWRTSREARVLGFVNSRPTSGDGTHEMGFRDGMAAAVNGYARERRLLTEADPDLGVDRIGEGLTAVVSVKLDCPEFEFSPRDRLGNASVRACVGQAVQEHLREWLDGHPEQAAAIIGRITRDAHQR